ncbi:DUF481 domain-containing protein [Pseudomonas fluvialis]|jgi:hypothetical protein|uniref:DUF481 domain-containing protein n=1 Tax=Pseudomonas fluvialis TaxID=1793966 RepID=UPI0035B0F9EC
MWRVLFLCMLAWPALADTVWLNNGDRLSGTIILMDGGKLVLDTTYAGRVVIDWKNIQTLSSETALLLRGEGVTAERAQRLQAAEPGQVRLLGETPRTLALRDINRAVPPRQLVDDLVWEGNLDFKLDIEREADDTDELKIKGDTRIEHGPWRHLLKGELEDKRKNDAQTKDNWELEYDLDRFFAEQLYWRSSLDWQEDAMEALRRQRSIGMGPGYLFWDDELGRLDMTLMRNRFRLEGEQRALTFDTWSLETDYKRLLWGTRVELYGNAKLQMPDIQQIDYVLDGEMGLRYRLNSWARLSLLYELDQVRGLGVTQSQRRYLIGLGVGW